MSVPVIVDSSALYSLASRNDRNHEPAVRISKALDQTQRQVILPTEVLAETLNIIGKKLGRPKQLDVARDLMTAEAFLIPPTTDAIRTSALATLATTPESVSFTDCLVMAFADAFTTTDIFGFDEIFGKRGYVLPDYQAAA